MDIKRALITISGGKNPPLDSLFYCIQLEPEGTSRALCACDAERGVVALEDVFDDRETQSRADFSSVVEAADFIVALPDFRYPGRGAAENLGALL